MNETVQFPEYWKNRKKATQVGGMDLQTNKETTPKMLQ